MVHSIAKHLGICFGRRSRRDAWLAFQLCHLIPRPTSQKTIDEAVLLADVGVQWL
jgi:hypothetical protein